MTAELDRMIDLLAAVRTDARELPSDIDEQIYRSVFGTPDGGDYRGESLRSTDQNPYSGDPPRVHSLPRYTRTEEDARTLLPGGSVAIWRLAPRMAGDPYTVTVYDSPEAGSAPTLPLAICLAALRYRRAQELHVGGDRFAEFRTWLPPMARDRVLGAPADLATAPAPQQPAPRQPQPAHPWPAWIAFAFWLISVPSNFFILSLRGGNERAMAGLVLIGSLVALTIGNGLGRVAAFRRAGVALPFWAWPFLAAVTACILGMLYPFLMFVLGGPGAVRPLPYLPFPL